MSFEPNPNFLAELTRDLQPRGDAGAKTGAASISANLARGERTGTHYPQLPYRSSHFTEFAQEQDGDLRAGVYHERTGDLAWEVGIKSDNLARLIGQEFGVRAGRKNITRTMEDEDTQTAMLEAMREGG